MGFQKQTCGTASANHRDAAGTPGLHVPMPTVRTSGGPDFSHVPLADAGALRRPSASAPEEALRDLPYSLIRVLDDEGRAHGDWDPRWDPELLRRGLRAMVATRIIDDRMFNAHRQGKTSFYIKSTGEEAIGAAQAFVMGPDDMVFTSYRSLSWLVARDYPLLDLFNQILANADDPMRGRQMPILYSSRQHGFYSLSGNVGSRIGHAVGWAMAAAYKRSGRLALAHVGEGTSAEGDFHEAMTFASTYRAPAILCIVNNQWAISTFSGIAGGDAPTFAAKALGYGMPGLRVDGNDFLAIVAATEWAVERARCGLGPSLIELLTYRAGGHSTSDDPTKYRPADEAEHWPLGDPIERLKLHLASRGEWSEERHVQLSAELKEEIRSAQRISEQVGTFGNSKPSVREMFEGVFREGDWRLQEQRREAGV